MYRHFVRYLRDSVRFLLDLFRKDSREILIFMGFLLLSLVFWYVEVLDEEYETVLSVPIRVRDVPDEVIMTYDAVDHLEVQVRAKGSDILAHDMTGGLYPVTLRFPEFSKDGSPARVAGASLRSAIADQLSTAIQILSIKPDTLEYFFTRGSFKRVPIRFQGEVRTVNQYFLTDTILSVDSVQVFAQERMLDTLRYVSTRYLEVEGVKETCSRQVEIVQPKGFKTVPDRVTVTFPVDIYTEKTLDVEIQGVGFPKNRQLKTFPPRVQALVQIPMSQYQMITSEDLRVSVDYEDLMSLESDHFQVRLDELPRGVRKVTFSPSSVDFIIEQKSE